MSADGELIISSSALENDCDREPLLQMRNKSSPIGSIVICARSRLSHTRGHRKWAKPGPNKMWARTRGIGAVVCVCERWVLCAEAEPPPPRRLIVSMGRDRQDLRARCNYTWSALGKDPIRDFPSWNDACSACCYYFLARGKRIWCFREKENCAIGLSCMHEFVFKFGPRQWAWSCRRMFVYLSGWALFGAIPDMLDWIQSFLIQRAWSM